MLPSPLTILASVVAVFLIVLAVVRGPVDADFWWHLTTGRLILADGAVPTVDPFSFAYDGPWVAHEWLGEVVIAALVDTVGYGPTAALFGAAAAGALLLPAWAMCAEGVAVRAVAPFVAIGTYVLAPYVTVRPQVLSWLLLGALLALLLRLRPSHRARPWLVVPLIVLWANLHGLWVVGVGTVAVFALFTLAGRTAFAPRRATAIGMAVGGVAAALVTPAGVDGWLYPLRYLRQDDWGTAFIAEWQPADVTDPRQWGVAALLLAAVALIRWSGLTWQTAIGALALVGAVIAVRNGPIAAVAALPMLSLGMDRAWPRRGPQREVRGRRIVELGAAAIVVVATILVLPAVASGNPEDTFPVQALDTLRTEEAADARALVDYDWGGYAINRLYPGGGSVFIDGRSDMYPREIFEDYLAVRGAEPGWQAVLERYGVDAIVLPPTAPLVDAATEDAWCERSTTETAVLLRPC